MTLFRDKCQGKTEKIYNAEIKQFSPIARYDNSSKKSKTQHDYLKALCGLLYVYIIYSYIVEGKRKLGP